MATFKTGIKTADKGMAEGRKAWDGEIPPSGSYEGILRTVTIRYITSEESANKGKPKLLIGVELTNTEGGAYDGYVAWGNLNLIEGSEAYVNQFLFALTDGSDKQFNAIKAAFDKGFSTDERKKHVLKIGRWNINSPKGEIPILISLKKEPYFNEKTKTSGFSTRIVSYLNAAGEEASGPTQSGPEEVIEDEEDEDTTADVDAEDEDEDADEDILND